MIDRIGCWPWKISWTISRDTLAFLIVAVIDRLMGTVQKIVSWAGKFLTALRTVLWRIGAIVLSDFLSKFVSGFLSFCAKRVDELNRVRKKASGYEKIIKIITCFFSTGGIVALFLDHITDGITDEKINFF